MKSSCVWNNVEELPSCGHRRPLVVATAAGFLGKTQFCLDEVHRLSTPITQQTTEQRRSVTRCVNSTHHSQHNNRPPTFSQKILHDKAETVMFFCRQSAVYKNLHERLKMTESPPPLNSGLLHRESAEILPTNGVKIAQGSKWVGYSRLCG